MGIRGDFFVLPGPSFLFFLCDLGQVTGYLSLGFSIWKGGSLHKTLGFSVQSWTPDGPLKRGLATSALLGLGLPRDSPPALCCSPPESVASQPVVCSQMHRGSS